MTKQAIPKKISTADDEVTLKDIILSFQKWSNYLLSKWRIILIFGLLGAFLGFLYAIAKKPLYVANTTFVLEDSGQEGSNQYSGLASMMGINLGNAGSGLFSASNIQALYQSRSMLQQALMSETVIDGQKDLLINRYIAFNGLRQEWEDNPNLANIQFIDTTTFTIDHNSILNSIIADINANYLTVGTDEINRNIIKVEVKSIDEAFSKDFTEQLVSTVNNFYIELKTKKALANLAILQHQTDSVQAVMNGAIYESAATMDATPNLNPTRQVLRTSVQRSQFNAEASKAMLGELVKNLEFSKMSLRKETPLIQIIDQPVLPLKKESMGRLKGIAMGGLVFGFLAIFYLFINKNYKEIMEGEDYGIK